MGIRKSKGEQKLVTFLSSFWSGSLCSTELRFANNFVIFWGVHLSGQDKERNVTETFHKIKVTVPDSCPGSRNPDFCARIINEDSPENFEKVM